MRKPTVEETSAGGLVLDRSGAVARAALIARHDRKGQLVWSMPKGHLELGETAEDAAVREVHEEIDRLLDKLTTGERPVDPNAMGGGMGGGGGGFGGGFFDVR